VHLGKYVLRPSERNTLEISTVGEDVVENVASCCLCPPATNRDFNFTYLPEASWYFKIPTDQQKDDLDPHAELGIVVAMNRLIHPISRSTFLLINKL